MYDEILDWIEDHRVLIFIVVGVLLLVFGVKLHNSKKAEKVVQIPLPTPTIEVTPSPTPIVTEKPDFQTSLSMDEIRKREKQAQIKQELEEEKRKAEERKKKKNLKPNFDVSCNVFSHTNVPKTNVDGSSCKDYFNSVTLVDFDTYWGSALGTDDMKSKTRYLVGVEQDDIDEEIADLQSVGWLISNFNKLGKHDAIKFTNLHVIGKLSNDHVALLCSYDWYSVFGMKDTLVVFEDISDTLEVKDFKAGDVFSATVFVHNIRIKRVNNENVVCVQYNVYN